MWEFPSCNVCLLFGARSATVDGISVKVATKAFNDVVDSCTSLAQYDLDNSVHYEILFYRTNLRIMRCVKDDPPKAFPAVPKMRRISGISCSCRLGANP